MYVVTVATHSDAKLLKLLKENLIKGFLLLAFSFYLLLFSDWGKMCFDTFVLETSILHELKPKR